MENKSNKALSILLLSALFILGVGIAYYVGKVTTELRLIKQEVNIENNVAKQPDQDQKSREEIAKNVEPLSNDDHVYGNREASVVIYSYSDIECPYCATFHETMSEVMRDYSENVAWVFRHFPLDAIHKNAREAAISSECVAAQTEDPVFFNYLDTLFANQAEITTTLIQKKAETLVGDVDKYRECKSGDESTAKVQRDQESGLKAGIKGTPGTIIYNSSTDNIIVVPGLVDKEALRDAIDSII